MRIICHHVIFLARGPGGGVRGLMTKVMQHRGSGGGVIHTHLPPNLYEESVFTTYITIYHFINAINLGNFKAIHTIYCLEFS